MAELENQVAGVSVKDEQCVLPEAQHETTDAGEKTKGPARLLVVLGEVHNVEQRDLALGRVVAGWFLAINSDLNDFEMFDRIVYETWHLKATGVRCALV